MPIHSSSLRVFPFTLLCTLLLPHPAIAPACSFTRVDTDTFTALTAALFGDRCRRSRLTVATLGQAYPAAQLLPPAMPLAAFGARAAALLRHVSPQLDQGSPLPPLLPVYPDTQLSARAPVRWHAAHGDEDPEPPFCQIIGFPCALLGRAKALHAFLDAEQGDPLMPLPAAHPALQALDDFLRARFSLPQDALWVVGPLPIEAVKQRVRDLYAAFRRYHALTSAWSGARTVSAPRMATVACYGDTGRIHAVSLTVQRMDTAGVIKTHVFKMADFPQGITAVQRVLDELCFVWGIQMCHTHLAVLPVTRDAAGRLRTFPQGVSHRTLSLVSTAKPETEH